MYFTEFCAHGIKPDQGPGPLSSFACGSPSHEEEHEWFLSFQGSTYCRGGVEHPEEGGESESSPRP